MSAVGKYIKYSLNTMKLSHSAHDFNALCGVLTEAVYLLKFLNLRV